MIQILQLKGKDKQLYRLLAPLVMDPDVIRANNNYPFKTNDNYTWFVAVEDKTVIGFIPVEHKSSRLAIINNYYVGTGEDRRKTILLQLLSDVIAVFSPDKWGLQSVTLKQDQEAFESLEFVSMDNKWTRYIKMQRG